MKDLQIFQYDEQEIRTVEKDGEYWWVLADVCKVLELKLPHRVAARLDEDEKGRTFMTTLGGEQEITIINESGLYNVIIRSNKPEAKKFKRWVTHEILPTIRKTGTYSINPDARIDKLTEEVIRLTEIVTQLQHKAKQTVHSPKRLIALHYENLNQGARKSWMRKFNQYMDMLEENFVCSRKELLHQLYVIIEHNEKVILDEERVKCMERLEIDDCSCLEAVYHNPALRNEMQRLILLNLCRNMKEW